MKLKAVQRKYVVTFEECRRVIQLFMTGISVENMVRLTGLHRSKIFEVLFVTRELLLSKEERGIRSLIPR